MRDIGTIDDYFDWLYFQVVNMNSDKRYRKLLSTLHNIDFRYFIDYDENRASDGENLRWYYVDDGGDDSILEWRRPCTVLEMIISVAMRMDTIVGDTDGILDIRHFFWVMMDNLDLAWMIDEKYDKNYIYGKVTMFLDRNYESDGYGNIIYIRNCKEDLREVEIWSQMCWYLNSIL